MGKVQRSEELTHQPNRVVVGHCPSCRKVIVIFNNYETWPPAICECGWAGASTKILNHTRFEREGIVTDIYRPSERGGHL